MISNVVEQQIPDRPNCYTGARESKIIGQKINHHTRPSSLIDHLLHRNLEKSNKITFKSKCLENKASGIEGDIFLEYHGPRSWYGD